MGRLSDICTFFGCGRNLTALEKLCGDKCLNHQNNIKTISMSMADYYADLAAMYEPNLWEDMYDPTTMEEKYKNKMLYWYNSFDERIKVQALTVEHLGRIIGFLHRLKKENKTGLLAWILDTWIKILGVEHQRRVKNAFDNI